MHVQRFFFFLIGAFYVEGGRSQHHKDPRKQNNFRLSLQAEISSSIVIVFQLIRTYIVFLPLSWEDPISRN